MGRPVAIGVGVAAAAALAVSGAGIAPNVRVAGPHTSAEAEASIRPPPGPITQVKCKPAGRKWRCNSRTPAGKTNSTELVNGPDTGVFIVC